MSEKLNNSRREESKKPYDAEMREYQEKVFSKSDGQPVYSESFGHGHNIMKDGPRNEKEANELKKFKKEFNEKIQTNEPSPEARSSAVGLLASEFHEDWRMTRLGENGVFEPRIKPTKDEAWITTHGTDQVDIANTAYLDLPSDWQTENKAAAEVVVDIFGENNGEIDLSNSDTRNLVGEKVHSAWLSRNEWAKGGELDIPFDKLPENEQDKDINQIVVAQRVFNK